MDNFMDKLAQKLSAQEVIKANSQAEAAEMKKLQLQVAEYEKILQEMRKLNYKNSELSEKIDSQVGENTARIKELQQEEIRLLSLLRDITDEQIRNREDELNKKQTEEEDKASQQKSQMEALFKNSDEHVHMECVKVYRNVQAVIGEELKKQTEEINASVAKSGSKITVVMIISLFSMLISAAGLIFQILGIMNINLF